MTRCVYRLQASSRFQAELIHVFKFGTVQASSLILLQWRQAVSEFLRALAITVVAICADYTIPDTLTWGAMFK